jgi:hypothetical protein
MSYMRLISWIHPHGGETRRIARKAGNVKDAGNVCLCMNEEKVKS